MVMDHRVERNKVTRRNYTDEKNALFITIQGKQLSVCGKEIKRRYFFPNTWQRGYFDNGRVAISLWEDMFFVMYLHILIYVNKNI